MNRKRRRVYLEVKAIVPRVCRQAIVDEQMNMEMLPDDFPFAL